MLSPPHIKASANIKNTHPPGGKSVQKEKSLLYIHIKQTNANTNQNVNGTTFILKRFFTITIVPNNKIKAYPNPTGKDILYQANNGSVDNTAIDILHINGDLFLLYSTILVTISLFFFVYID